MMPPDRYGEPIATIDEDEASTAPHRELRRPVDSRPFDLRSALVEAELPPLLPTLAYLTGDLGLLRPELRTDPSRAIERQGGLSDEQQEAVKAVTEEVMAHRPLTSGDWTPLLAGSEVRQPLAYLTGGGATEAELDFLEEELDIEGRDPRAPAWRKEAISPGRPFVVGLIGAGMSGLAAAHRIGQAGVDYIVFEKNAAAGGTWFENRYPGCRVDITSHAYSYSFTDTPWPNHYSPQGTLAAYFQTFARDAGIDEHVRYETEVIGATFDAHSARWRVHTRSTADGRVPDGEVEVDALVSAVGQLNRAHVPTFDGEESFGGICFHSSRWPTDLDLRGRRVAVIGSGASAAQLVPGIAGVADEVTVYQRTPAWFFPDERYHQPIGAGLRSLFDRLPSYSRWYRAWQVWQGTTSLLPHCKVDPAWNGGEASVSELSDQVRLFLTEYLKSEYAGRPDLLEKVVPSYPPMAKRILIDDGTWARTMQRDDVELVTDPIERFTPAGIKTRDGRERPADVIVLATGFHASKFLMPMRITGESGRTLEDCWGGDARAYLGIMVPHFPNLFLLYGPNTNIVINGTIIFFSECEVRFVLESLRTLFQNGYRALQPSEEAYEEYGRYVDDGNRSMAWGVSSVNTWYKNEFGRSAQNWPYGLVDYWEQTRRLRPGNFSYI